MRVLHLRKPLDAPPVVTPLAGITVRQFRAPNDVDAWLDLHHRATAGLAPAPRRWRHEDFQREMLDKPWWQPQRNWLAIAGEARLAGGRPARRGSPAIDPSASQTALVGCVTLALREGLSRNRPVVHWLLVDSAWRRRGIGSLLMAHLERAVWDAGFREVALETHTGWTAAVGFYQSIGYEAVREPAAR